MGGGGGAPGGIARPVQRATESQIQKGQQLKGARQPALDEGIGQFMELLSTGGSGARVPIIQQAVAGQQRATRNAQQQISSAAGRGGLDTNVLNRLLTQIGTAGGARAGAIGPAIAAPLVLGNIQNTLSAGRAGGQAIQQGIGAAAGGFRQALPNAARQSLGRNLANVGTFAAGGGFGDLSSLFRNAGTGGGGAGGAPIGGTGSRFPTLTAG